MRQGSKVYEIRVKGHPELTCGIISIVLQKVRIAWACSKGQRILEQYYDKRNSVKTQTIILGKKDLSMYGLCGQEKGGGGWVKGR